MKVTFELQQVDALATLKTYAQNKNLTIDQIVDLALAKMALNLKAKEEQKCSAEDQYNMKADRHPINDYVKSKLKFPYIILKDGSIICNQFGKQKDLNYSFDTGTGDAYVYLLLQGCPNRADIATLQKYSIKINVEELYDQIYGKGTFEKYARKNVMNKIEASQKAWKEKNRGGK